MEGGIAEIRSVLVHFPHTRAYHFDTQNGIAEKGGKIVERFFEIRDLWKNGRQTITCPTVFFLKK